MENNLDYPAYREFCIKRRKDLQRIANATRGTHDLSDVESEALLMADEMRHKKDIRIDWKCPADHDLLLSYLFQHLVRYTERHLQFATRLDHWSGDGGEDEPHPLFNILAADEGTEPLTALIKREETIAATLREPDCHYSAASAYIHLLRHFDNRMKDVADHLLISLSYCYRRYAKVRTLTECQRPMPMHWAASGGEFLPGAWRRFRIHRTPVQLSFDFETEQGFSFAAG